MDLSHIDQSYLSLLLEEALANGHPLMPVIRTFGQCNRRLHDFRTLDCAEFHSLTRMAGETYVKPDYRTRALS